MSSSRISFEKTFYFYPDGDPHKERYDDDFYESLTLRFYNRILPIIKSFGNAYRIECDIQNNDYNPEYHMLEYTLSYASLEEDNILDPNIYANIKLDFIAIETIMIEIADDYDLVLE